MRYFDCTLRIKEEDIKSETVDMRDLSYDSRIDALNIYMFRTLCNGVTFLVYRDEKSFLRAMLATESKPSDAMGEILSALDYLLGKKVDVSVPEEITLFDFDENMDEARRRGILRNWGRIADNANNLIYDMAEPHSGRRFVKFTEMLSGKPCKDHLFDASFKAEEARIKASGKTGDETHIIGAHYEIAARSIEAGIDIAKSLVDRLVASGRLSSRRIEVFSDIDEDLYRTPNYIEDILDNSKGGAVIINLREKFGSSPADYVRTCECLAGLIRKHRNDNLFCFVYEMDNPGFAFKLITLIKKNLYRIPIREGRGGIKLATKYLEQLIEDSELSQYADQAGEYLSQNPRKSYTQTDILSEFEMFESWCMRKNVLTSYALEGDDDFTVDRDAGVTSYEQLQSMIGLTTVKTQIDNIILANKVDRQRQKKDGQGRLMHMTFSGNPGCGKTEVAKLFAGIMKDAGVLTSGVFVEMSGTRLNFTPMVVSAFEEAKGGVLFIDEAYGLVNPLAITELIRQMEALRNEVIVILAGYEGAMKAFLQANDGLQSRIPYTIHFPDYKPEELTEIYSAILKRDGYTATSGALNAASEILRKASKLKNFGNGRYARTLAEKSILNMSVRLARKYGDDKVPESKIYRILKDDIYITNDALVNCNTGSKTNAKERLAETIGLESAKKVIDSAIAMFKFQKRLRDRGTKLDNNTMHMVFMGNPGTAKTTVARLLAEVLRDEGILSSGNFVEAGRSDLVGQFVGQTAPLVKMKFDEANGGVLFIDEAYSLNDGVRGGFGDEAITTIVQEMDNRREDLIVIFAGYPDEMREFVDKNPGMSSRIAYRIDFEDYTTEQLVDITKLIAKQKHVTLTGEAAAKLVPIFEKAKTNKTFGNGRYARRIVEQSIANLALRLRDVDDKDLTDKMLTTIEAEDIEAPKTEEEPTKRAIGFTA